MEAGNTLSVDITPTPGVCAYEGDTFSAIPDAANVCTSGTLTDAGIDFDEETQTWFWYCDGLNVPEGEESDYRSDQCTAQKYTLEITCDAMVEKGDQFDTTGDGRGYFTCTNAADQVSDLSWSFTNTDTSGLDCGTLEGTQLTCQVSDAFPDKVIGVTATNGEGASITYPIIVNDPTLGAMELTCTPEDVISGQSTTCQAKCGQDTNYTWLVLPSEGSACAGSMDTGLLSGLASCSINKTTQDSVTVVSVSNSCNA